MNETYESREERIAGTIISILIGVAFFGIVAILTILWFKGVIG